jgi:hypothetical protein
MKNVLIVENTSNSLTRLDESVVNGEKKYVLGGPFTEFGVKNRNERIYTADKFIPALNEMKERMDTLGVVYGEFDHPDVFDTSLSRASHIIKSIDYVEESNRVDGQIQLLSTYWGKEARSIVNDGCPLFVSSRAAGITESDGSVSLKKLFTYDIVADPGFGSAKMSSINESVGYSDSANFRIYEMSDESKINDLFKMNKNDLVTKTQLGDYSKYLVDEIKTTNAKVNEAVKVGKLDSKRMEELLSYYESLQEDHAKLIQYLDYLAEKMQIVVNENTNLKNTQDQLIEHNDYLAENLEKNINYSEYLAENLDKNIEYSEYIAENVDKSIEYSEYIAENVDKSIEYSEYIAENVDKSIEYSEYIAENVDNNIAYSEYIAENLEGNIAYSEYIAENLDDNIAYSDYIAENLDKSIGYSKMIAEKLNTSKAINENFDEEGDQRFPLPEEEGFDVIDDEDEDETDVYVDEMDVDKVELDDEGSPILTDDENCEVVCDDDEEDMGDDLGSSDDIPGMEDENEDNEDNFEDEDEDDAEGIANENLDRKIDKLINEAKKRKASETNEHHFLKFLNKSQVNSFYNLDNDEQEKVVAHINETGNYMSSNDVIKLMQEALSLKIESLEEKLVRLMPDSIKPTWEKLEEKRKVSVLSQAKLHPELKTEEQVEHFWLTRNIKAKAPTKQLVSESRLIQDDSLSEDAIEGIMERFKNL